MITVVNVTNVIVMLNVINLVENNYLDKNKLYVYSARKEIVDFIKKNKHWYYRVFYTPVLFNKNKNNNIYNQALEVYYVLKQLHKEIKNNKFILYTPHLGYIRESIFICSYLCKGYYFIEEGLPSYREDIISNKKYNSSILNRLLKYFYARKSQTPEYLPIYKNFYLGAVCNNKESYSFSEKRVEFSLPFSHITLEPSKSYKNIKCVFIADKIDMNNDDVYIHLVQVVINYLKSNNIEQVHIKFHPDDINKISWQQKLINCFSQSGITVTIIQDVYIEEIVMNNLNAVYITIKSAIILYLSQLPVKAISINCDNIKSANYDILFRLHQKGLIPNTIQFI